MDIVSLLVSLASGAVGGNAAGAAMPNKSLGTVGNSLAGILGGGVGAAVLQALGTSATTGGGLDIASIVGNVASGGVGGGLAMAVIAMIKNAMSQRA
jgi:uncharacterized membrane protein YeaQ/YmgE (transglycosylase-associated protein family)